MPPRPKASPVPFMICCGALVWATAMMAQPAGHATSSGAPVGNMVFLWLALGCFGFAGLLVLRRTMRRTARHRANHSLRLWRWDPSGKRGGGLLRWWVRRELQPRSVRVNGWEARTRRAELKAEQAIAALRSELTPHLATIMKDRLVWTLMTQRARLLNAHQANSEKVATLEHRLTAIQMQIRKQAEAYESRIAELEQELTEKNRLTRELLKFRVSLARQALDAVRLDKTPVNTAER